MERENHPNAREYLDCSRCLESVPEIGRARWNCGLMAPADRLGPGFPTPPGAGVSSDICPGYLITLPQVVETARARLHWERGCLSDRYEGEPLTGLLFDCLEILQAAIGDLESRAMNEASNGDR